MAKRVKSGSSKHKLHAKKRKEMVAEINKEDQTIHEEALEILWSSLQFEEYQWCGSHFNNGAWSNVIYF